MADPPDEAPTQCSVASSGSAPWVPLTPMTPRSPGSPAAFFYHSASVTAVVLAPPSPSDEGDASCSPPATGDRRLYRCLLAFLRVNVVQRILSALVLAPLITVFLWLSPAFATATFCTFVTSICSYEYAWLAHRIHLRVMTKMQACEPRLLRSEVASNSSRNPREGDSSRASISYSRSTRSESASDVDRDVVAAPHQAVYSSRARTAASSSGETVQSSPLTPPPPPTVAAVEPEVENASSPQRASAESTPSEDETYLHDSSFSRCAMSSVADQFFSGNVWFAAVVVSALTTVVTTAIFLFYVQYIPEMKQKELYRLRWFYSIATDFVAALSALFTPNWKYALICLVWKTVFTLLTMHSTACPINRFRCGVSLEPAQVFLSGVVIIVFFRLNTRTTGPDAFLHIALDMLGYLYIIGSLSVIVAFVDDERLESYRKLLIVLLYVVWASDTGAYLTGKLLEWLNYSYYNPLASHLSKNKDYEGTLGAIVFGVVAMFVSSDLLDVPGSALAQIGFTVLAVVVGRLGDLFESLLKRAAGVKDSGKLIPGHGGVLDRIDALMFASLVFARYYAAIVT
ncbi:hypothetical protein BBJ28_00007095 [Nothophytophthora sp. Chile5]|nr:hypothetical protein BBJ28_00007095 [Nothophytophthora sp. Chile5]